MSKEMVAGLLAREVGLQSGDIVWTGRSTAEDLRDAMVMRGYLPAFVGAEHVAGRLGVIAHNLQLVSNHTYIYFPGEVLLLKACHGGSALSHDDLAGIAGNVRVVPVEADHFGMVRPPAVERVAAEILHFLRQRRRGRTSTLAAARVPGPELSC